MEQGVILTMDNKDYIITQLINENAQLKIDLLNLQYQLEQSKLEESEVTDSGKEDTPTG